MPNSQQNLHPAATAGFLVHVDLGGDAFLHGGDVGDDADGFASGSSAISSGVGRNPLSGCPLVAKRPPPINSGILGPKMRASPT